MQCIHERILSTDGEVGLEVILNSLYSIFTNALKQARRIQRDDCDEVYDEDGYNEDDDGWAEDCGFGMF
jgi:hypothetical protein